MKANGKRARRRTPSGAELAEQALSLRARRALKPAIRRAAGPSRRTPIKKIAAPAIVGLRAAGRVRSRVATVGGVRIFAAERPGARVEAKRAVVLIHGAGVDHRDWTHRFIALTPPSWRVLAVDRPGFGRSERPGGPASALPATQARILRAAVRAFGVREACLVGHSWGAAAAMAWALEAPDDVAGVVSLAGAIGPWSLATSVANARRMTEATRTALSGDVAGAARTALTDGFAPQRAPSGYHAHIASPDADLRRAGASALADAATLNGALALQAARYGDLRAPVELVYGARDAVLAPLDQIAATRPIANARTTLAPGVGHMVHHWAPRPCIEAIERVFD